MRFLKIATLVASSLLLVGCVSSLIIGSDLQNRLMWAFIEPLVGFNPNDIHFFDAPIIKNRMTALLGDKYAPVMELLNTANKIQQEGALYYVASRYAPPEAKAIVDSAGMVWNASTNQIAVMLVKDGIPEIISEQVEAGKQALVPELPKELKTVYDQAVAVKQELDAQKQQLENLQNVLENAEDPLLELIQQKEKEALEKAGN